MIFGTAFLLSINSNKYYSGEFYGGCGIATLFELSMELSVLTMFLRG